jgi:hypothetical protein
MSESARSILKHLYKEGRMTEEQYKKIDRNLKERPHGEWKLRSPYEVWFEEYKCSNCNAYGWFNWHFCPNCGADMRKKKGEHNEQTTD